MPAMFPKLLEAFPGFVKLNTDGSAKGNPGSAGFGGVIRDETGRWIKGFFGYIGVCSSIVAELWAIREGLRIMAELNHPYIIVESDCETAISLLKGSSLKDSAHTALLEDSWHYASKMRSCIFSHTLREGNKCADMAANMGVNQSIGLNIMESPPVEMSPLLVADMASVAFERLS
uniref:Putative LINE-type retrotransposon LIb DNA n=1 Tax=Davidia involucrata TaxID=16924 RepID=A0A5B7BAB3_DAVIN